MISPEEYEEGELFEVISEGSLLYKDTGSKSSQMSTVKIHPGQMGFVLKDCGGNLATTGGRIMFLNVYIGGRCGWIMDGSVRKI